MSESEYWSCVAVISLTVVLSICSSIGLFLAIRSSESEAKEMDTALKDYRAENPISISPIVNQASTSQYSEWFYSPIIENKEKL